MKVARNNIRKHYNEPMENPHCSCRLTRPPPCRVKVARNNIRKHYNEPGGLLDQMKYRFDTH